MKALLVDDEQNVRSVLRTLGNWEEAGVTSIFEAKNGREALAIIKKEEPELLFTDIKMPSMTGIELLEQLDVLGFTGVTVLVSGYDDYDYMRKAIQHGTFDYLLKPIEPDAFRSVLTRAAAQIRQQQLESHEDTELLEQARRLRITQLVTDACTGDPEALQTIQSHLPDEDMELTLLSSYQSETEWVEPLAGWLQDRQIGDAFPFQQGDLTVVLTIKGEWLSVEKWLHDHVEQPLRLTQSSLSGVPLPEAFQQAVAQMEANHYRAIRRLDDIENARRMEEMIAYVKAYYTEEITLDKLAKMFFLSREHISRKFKKETGVTLSKYIIALRIIQAKKWLAESDETIYTIAQMLGYQDEKYFSKLFKKETGMTPFDYRTSRADKS